MTRETILLNDKAVIPVAEMTSVKVLTVYWLVGQSMTVIREKKYWLWPDQQANDDNESNGI